MPALRACERGRGRGGRPPSPARRAGRRPRSTSSLRPSAPGPRPAAARGMPPEVAARDPLSACAPLPAPRSSPRLESAPERRRACAANRRGRCRRARPAARDLPRPAPGRLARSKAGSRVDAGARRRRLGPELLEQRQQLGGADRLGEVVVHAGGEAALAVAFHRVGGQGDDRAGGVRVPFSAARMAAVASKPSISGICTSISTTSNAPRSTGGDGLAAVVGDAPRVWPCFSSSRDARRWLTALSSASRMRSGRPSRRDAAARTAATPRSRLDRRASSAARIASSSSRLA